MIFNSISYFIFLQVVWLIFQATPDRFRWLLLLLASLTYYASFKAPYLLVVLTLVAVVTYATGALLERQQNEARQRYLFWCGITLNLLVLASFKYLPLLISSFYHQPTSQPNSHLLITIGISYYVFQAISYLADVYLGIIKAETNFGYLFLSLAFFPKLLQGPIERAADLLPQLKQPYNFDYDMVRSGMLLFLWGLFKKVVIADRLALAVDPVYDNVHEFQGLQLLVATYYYAIQIYFDFSGYTDMALGTARMFSINLTQNFNNPYGATSIADFWRRWHISFSRWILDYIFKPLQMSWRNWRNQGTALALIVTFLVSGVWHGASLTFVCWGLLHGIYLATSIYYKPLQKKIHYGLGVEKTLLLKIWQTLITFNLVCIAWILFRANSLSDVFYIFSHLIPFREVNLKEAIHSEITSQSISIVVCALLAYLVDINRSSKTISYEKFLHWGRWPVYYLLTMSVILFGIFSKSSKFIYLKF